MATPDQTTAPPADGWVTLTAWIGREAHRTGFDNPANAAAEWHRTNQHRWHQFAAAAVRAVLTEAAHRYEHDIRATRGLHPRKPLPWPHADLARWLTVEAGRREHRPAQNEPGT